MLSPLTLATLLGVCAAAATPAAGERRLTNEPLILELFGSSAQQQQQQQQQQQTVSSCLGSVFKMRNALQTVASFQTIFADFLPGRGSEMSDAERRILQFCQQRLQVEDEATYFQHPVNAHKFVATVVMKINPALLTFVKEHAGAKNLLQHLVQNGGCWLGESCLDDSRRSLVSLKLFYNLTMPQLAAGDFAGRRSKKPLTTEELHDLLLMVNRRLEAADVVEFAEFLRSSRDLSGIGRQRIRSLYRMLAKAYHQLQQQEAAEAALSEHQTKYDPSDERVAEDLRYIREFRRDAPTAASAGGGGGGGGGNERPLQWQRQFDLGASGFHDYWVTCSGAAASPPPPPDSASPLLVCELARPLNGWFSFKKEIYSVRPLTVYYHDVFSSTNNSEALLQETQRRTLDAADEADLVQEAERTLATVVRLHSFRRPPPPFDSNITAGIIRRLELLTGLDSALHPGSVEKYIDMRNFGHGTVNKLQRPRQPQRSFHSSAVAMFFPGQAAVGGNVVLPALRLSFPTARAGLLLWFDFLPNFRRDSATNFSACPVLAGDFWTATVALGQRLCSADQEVQMEQQEPGGTIRRRRATEKPWPRRAAGAGSNNATSSDGSSGNSTHSNSTDSSSGSGHFNASSSELAADTSAKAGD